MESKLLNIGTHEARNEFEASLRQAFVELEPRLRPPFSIAIPTPQEYSQLNHALLYGVLTEPQLAKIHTKHLHGMVSDGYALFVSLTRRVVLELYTKLVDSVKEQLIWVVKELVHVSGVGVDGLLVGLLRQTVDCGDRSLWLCFELINLLLTNLTSLLEEEPFVLTSALYVYLRLLGDRCRVSGNARVDLLKKLEIEFCVKMLRKQFHLCVKIGRDLVRLLQDLVHVPEFRSIWKDLLLDPTKFRTEGFSGIAQLYSTRTSSRYFLLRVTPEMELQLRFLLVHVKFRYLKRYQMWFAKKFLFEPERETLIVDMIRFICCAHHPSNDIIHSDISPRWAIVGWLLSCCRKKHVEANAKLALFYDWLFFDERMDSIMNIEPAMLLMVCSIPLYVGMTQSLLEFLLLLVDNYDEERSCTIGKGVSLAFNCLVSKGVINSVDVLTSCDALAPFLKERLKKLLSSTNETVPHQLYPNQLTRCSAVFLNQPNDFPVETPASHPKHESTGASCTKAVTDIQFEFLR